MNFPMDTNTEHLIALKAAQEELIMHHKDLEKCAAELKIANARISTGAMIN
jgi:hypothetical protein